MKSKLLNIAAIITDSMIRYVCILHLWSGQLVLFRGSSTDLASIFWHTCLSLTIIISIVGRTGNRTRDAVARD